MKNPRYLRFFLLTLLSVLFVSSAVFAAAKVSIDTSAANDGYITATYTGAKKPGPRMKLTLIKGTEKYTYDLDRDGNTETFPLQMGNGEYTVQFFEHVVGNKYALVSKQSFTVQLKDEMAPFLISNQYVEYENSALTKQTATELTEGLTKDDEKVEAIYKYIVGNIAYDYDKAATVSGDYLPTNDNTLTSKTGICFDYSSLLAAMLRLNQIPTRLVIGYVNIGTGSNEYHAWNEVYLEGQGWVQLAQLQFSGQDWERMDSTFGVNARYDVINVDANYQPTEKY